MSYSDVEHFGNIVSGCEAINQGNRTDPNARYAFAVLKLHATDFPSVSGNEGFLDGIKKGAQATSEWIIKLLKAIREFFFGTQEQKFNKAVTETESIAKEIADPEKAVGKTIPELIKSNSEIKGTNSATLVGEFNKLDAEQKKEAEEKLRKVLAGDSLNKLGEDAIKRIQSKLSSILTSITSASNSIFEFSKGNEHITYDLNGLSSDSEKFMIDEVKSYINHLKITNLSTTIKWFVALAHVYTKDLETITKKADEMVKSSKDQIKSNRIAIIAKDYANIVKGYRDMVIAINVICKDEISSAQDKVIKTIFYKQAVKTTAAADNYSGNIDKNIADFYSK